jgi:glycosyltransferase involved in cell wall biosynthesis
MNINIDVLLPVYNDEKYIGFCLDSIKGQTYRNFRCLIGFNGTYDKSKDIAREKIGNDPRFIIFDYGHVSGKSITLNKLLKEAESEYICLIDGDDCWAPNKLERQIPHINKYDVIGSLCNYVDEHNNITSTIRLPEFDMGIKIWIESIKNPIVNQSCLFKKNDIIEAGGWRSDKETIEDFDMWIRLSRSGKTFYNIQEPLVYHRIHNNSNFNANPEQGTILKEAIIRTHFKN